MPVPAPRLIRYSSHPVNKSDSSISITKPVFQQIPHNLPLHANGVSAAVGAPGERRGPLGTWAPQKSRKSWDILDDRENSENMGFHAGLTGAGNAPVIKGSRAQAPFPPLFPSLTFAAPTSFERHSEIDDDDVDSDYSGMQYGNGSEWSYDDDAEMDDALDRSFDAHYEAAVAAYAPGDGSPFLDDLSPVAFQDPASSPGPVTPFGDFVDRAVTSQPTAFGGAEYPSISYSSREESQRNACGPHCRDYRPAQPAPAPIIPTATDAYRKLVDPMSEWIANYVWKVSVVDGPSEMRREHVRSFAHPRFPPTQLASSIRSLLLSTLMQPPAIFLALLYIHKLPVYVGHALVSEEEAKFRFALLGEPSSPERADLEAQAPFRVAVLGFMLANKWLEDNTFSNATWAKISSIPRSWLNMIEASALSLLDFNLRVSTEDWSWWLEQIDTYHSSLASGPSPYPQPISRPSASPHTLIRKAIEETLEASRLFYEKGLPVPTFVGLAQQRIDKEHDMDEYDVDLDEDGPLPEEYLPKRRSSRAGSLRGCVFGDEVHRGVNHFIDRPFERSLPPPARWSPEADELYVREDMLRGVSSRHVSFAPRVPMMQANYIGMAPESAYAAWAPAPGYAPEKRYSAGAVAYAPAYPIARDVYGYPVSSGIHGRSQSAYGYDTGYGAVRMSPPEAWHPAAFSAAYQQHLWGTA